MKQLTTSVLVCGWLAAAGSAQPQWVQEFDDGVGRLALVGGTGANDFIYLPDRAVIEGTFVRRPTPTERYARIGRTFDAASESITFSTIMEARAANGQSCRAVADVGVFRAGQPQNPSALAIRFLHSTERGNQIQFGGYYDNGDEVEPRGEAPSVEFAFGVQYFITVESDVDAGVFRATIYQGRDASGEFRGILEREITPGFTITVDAIGMFNERSSCGDRVMTAWLKSVSFQGCWTDLSGSSDPNSPDYGVPDGQVDSSDFFTFLDEVVAGDLAIDLTGSSNPASAFYGIPDGIVDADDFFYYLDGFVEGC